MANVKLEGINKIFPNGFHAVKDANLEIQDKEFMVLVGPSGCGKTTTLRMIAGLEEITNGTVFIGPKVVNDISPKDRNIAMVFQNYALYPHMSVYQNLAFSLKLRKQEKNEIDEKVKKAANILGIGELLDRKPKQLSGGQRQRVALGRAIVREPEVFLMDEPLSNLDAKLRIQMRAELIKLQHNLDATFIYVTHDQTEAMTMGSKICVMNEGIIQQVDKPKVIYDRPVNQFVAGFIGAPQMNFLDAKIIKENDKIFAQYMDSKFELNKEITKVIVDEKYIDKDVIIGIRPEDIYFKSKDKGIKVKVEVAELLGNETNIYFSIGDTQLIAREKSDVSFNIGDEAFVSIDGKKIHVFDKETKKSILNN